MRPATVMVRARLAVGLALGALVAGVLPVASADAGGISLVGSITIPGAVVMLPYLLAFVGCLRWTARFQHKAPLYLLLAATLCGLAILAKGLAGLGLPVLIFLA